MTQTLNATPSPVTTSGYCCLNSTHTGINALAWYARVSADTGNDRFHSPHRALSVPLGLQRSLLYQSLEPGVSL